MNSRQTQYRDGLDIRSMLTTIGLLAPANVYSPHRPAFPLALKTNSKRKASGLAQPQGGSASGTMPAPLPAHQEHQATASSPKQIVKEVEEVEREEEERPGVLSDNVAGAGGKEEGEHAEGGCHADSADISESREEEEEKVEEFSFCIDDLQYDDDSGEVSMGGQSVQFASAELRQRVLKKLRMNQFKKTVVDDQDPKEIGQVHDQHPPLPRPLQLSHQIQRSIFAKVKQSKAKALGKWTTWTSDRLEAFLSEAFTKPRLGVFWAEYTPEEKVEVSKMVDWEATFPEDPPPPYLLANVGGSWSSMS